MSDAAPRRPAPRWGLRIAFIANIAALLLVAWCAAIILSIAYCGLFGPFDCTDWTGHAGLSIGMLAGPALALIGMASGIALVRRGADKRAIRALLGWSALAVGACFTFMLLMPSSL
jgi:hypothetical protein